MTRSYFTRLVTMTLMSIFLSCSSLQAGIGSFDGLLLDYSQANLAGLGPTKVAIGPDRRLYMSTDFGIILRVDDEQNVDLVGVVGNFTNPGPFGLLALFTAGITFDPWGNLYVVDSGGIYSFSAKQLKQDTVSLGHMPVLDASAVYALANPFTPTPTIQPNVAVASTVTPNNFYVFALGLAADPRGNLFLTDMLGGNIFKVDIDTGSHVLFADGSSPLYREISTDKLNPSSNPFAAAFGAADMDIDNRGEWLYFGTQQGADSNGDPASPGVYRLEIKNDGTAGRLQTLATFPGADQEFAINGISFDKVQKKVFISSPFRNFEKGTGGAGSGTNGINFNSPKVPVVTNSHGDLIYDDNDHIQTAGGVWQLEIDPQADQLPAGDISAYVTLKNVLVDPEQLGTAVDVISGWNFGKDGGNDWHTKLLVSDGGFDAVNSVWTNAKDGQIYSDEDKATHGAIRIIQLSE